MAKVLDVVEFRKNFLDELKIEIAQIPNLKRLPKLVVVHVKGDMASERYVANKVKACEEVGIESLLIELDESVNLESLKNVILEQNSKDDVDGLMLQLPLPSHLKRHTQELCDMIDSKKDVDGLSTMSIGRLWAGDDEKTFHAPCTAKGCILLTKHILQRSDFSGLNVCVVGRSNLVGKPASALFQRLNATVTMCHSRTKDIEKALKSADIVVLATGQAEHYKLEQFSDKALILDVGINRDKENRLCGDLFTREQCDSSARIYTPVPKGLGLMTVACLLDNTYNSYKNRYL